MFAVRRKAFSSLGGAKFRGVASRYASTGHGDAHASESSGDHGHHHSGPANESLGTQLYVVLAIIPVCYGVYVLSRDSKDGSVPAFQKLIASYSEVKDKWVQRNALHTKTMEQAAFDRNLFQSSKGSNHIDLRFPEIFNTGSPFNVVAGHSANLDELVAHYVKVNADGEEKKIKALEEKNSSK